MLNDLKDLLMNMQANYISANRCFTVVQHDKLVELLTANSKLPTENLPPGLVLIDQTVG